MVGSDRKNTSLRKSHTARREGRKREVEFQRWVFEESDKEECKNIPDPRLQYRVEVGVREGAEKEAVEEY